MGKEVAEPVIDLDFAGLSAPQAVFAIGRDDIKEDRPGDILVNAVREAKSNGVFAALQAERDSKMLAEKTADAFIARKDFSERTIPVQFQDAAKEIKSDNQD